MKVLITGVSGFIGFNLAKDLLVSKKNLTVYGIDNYDDYYSKNIKKIRTNNLKKFKNFKFFNIDIRNRKKIFNFFKKNKFKYIIHLAAQAGVRFSQIQPKKYIEVNIFGFLNLIDACLINKPEKFIYASSSSVYGDLKILPAKETNTLNPLNIYAISKKTNEIISRFYSNYHNLNFIGLRYFTVYGEWGRPDMFLFKLFKSYNMNKTFNLNNSGNHKRDFTYIKDAVEFTKRLVFKKDKKKKNEVFNICSNKPIKITKIISFFEKKIGKVKLKKVKRNKLDVKDTHGSNLKIKKYLRFKKFTNYEEGILNSYNWYKKNKIFKFK
tara:strand:+ start:761 stop:1732 length:972 start_codon:yes stop_codon:yes gene_type:complete